jgi:hypothetical protein
MDENLDRHHFLDIDLDSEPGSTAVNPEWQALENRVFLAALGLQLPGI